mmetsp:Transcript_27590/g.38910  ORF Transcript_27590/g.38910 Transcript_27590/m.38910 type:complete len:205 (-) Transcript_27590:32-646(-)
MEDQVKRTLRLLQSNPKMFSVEDAQLLIDLTTQFILFCSNFQVGGSYTGEGSKLMNSLVYLKTLVHSSTFKNEGGTTLSNEYINQNMDGLVVEGKKCYLLDGKPLHFKVSKNKPKNGDFQKRWNQSYQALSQFKDFYGHSQVTRSTPGFQELGNWVAEQRRKLKKGKITLKQFEALNDLGFEWDRSHYFHQTFEERKKRKIETC